MSINAIEMKPCENKLNHESILNGARDSKAADNCRYTNDSFSPFRLPLCQFALRRRCVHRMKMAFSGTGKKRKTKTNDIPANTFTHVHIFFAWFFRFSMCFPFIFISLLRSDQIKKDNNKFNVRILLFSFPARTSAVCSRMCWLGGFPYQNKIYSIFLFVSFVCHTNTPEI